MKRSIPLILIFLFAATGCDASSSTSPASISEKASAIDSQSREQLGVSLAALSMLTHVVPGRFFPKDMLVEDGQWERFKELEAAGYVTIAESPGLPDGSASGMAMVSIGLTARGSEIRSVLYGP